MRQIRLGNTNEMVSAVSLGTWSFGGENFSGNVSVGWAHQDDKDSRAVLLACWDNGIHHWDTADVYGDGRSEAMIGSMWNEIPRNKIFLATKVGWDQGSANHWYDPGEMRKNMERSLIKLKTDHVDLLYLHHCNFGKTGEFFDDALTVVKKFQEEGKTRFLGLSDWELHKIMKYIDRAKPDVVQPYRNIWDDTYASSGLQKYVEDHDLGVCFFSPLLHGLLTGKYSKPATFGAGDFRDRTEAFKDQKIIDKMQRNSDLLKQKFHDHPEPVLHGVVDVLLSDSKNSCVLLGQRNKQQAERAITLGEILDQADIHWIKKLYKH